MSGRARLSHRRPPRPSRHWAAVDTPMCAAFLRALATWVIAHHDDADARTMLPTGSVDAVELAQVLRALEIARRAAP